MTDSFLARYTAPDIVSPIFLQLCVNICISNILYIVQYLCVYTHTNTHRYACKYFEMLTILENTRGLVVESYLVVFIAVDYICNFQFLESSRSPDIDILFQQLRGTGKWAEGLSGVCGAAVTPAQTSQQHNPRPGKAASHTSSWHWNSFYGEQNFLFQLQLNKYSNALVEATNPQVKICLKAVFTRKRSV